MPLVPWVPFRTYVSLLHREGNATDDNRSEQLESRSQGGKKGALLVLSRDFHGHTSVGIPARTKTSLCQVLSLLTHTKQLISHGWKPGLCLNTSHLLHTSCMKLFVCFSDSHQGSYSKRSLSPPLLKGAQHYFLSGPCMACAETPTPSPPHLQSLESTPG